MKIKVSKNITSSFENEGKFSNSSKNREDFEKLKSRANFSEFETSKALKMRQTCRFFKIIYGKITNFANLIKNFTKIKTNLWTEVKVKQSSQK